MMTRPRSVTFAFTTRATHTPRCCSGAASRLPTSVVSLEHSSVQVTVGLYGHFVLGGDRHHVEGLAAALESARGALQNFDETSTAAASKKRT